MKFDTLEINKSEGNDSYFKELISELPVAIYTCDSDGYIKYFNKAAIELWGVEPKIGFDKWCGSWKIYYPDGTPMPIDDCPMALVIRENHSVVDEEIIIERPDGRKMNIIPHPKPILDPNGKVIGAINMLVDVTKQRLAEQSLKESEERLRQATEGTRLAIWELDLLSDKITYSNRLADIFGEPKSKILTHQELLNRIVPDDRKKIVEKAFRKAIEDGNYSYEARIILPNNEIRWIRIQGKVFYDNHQVPVRMLGTMQDITEYQNSRDSLYRLAAIVQTSEDAIISKTLEGIVTSWNSSAERIFGYTADEMIGQSITKLIPDDRLEEEPQILSRLSRGERVEHFETQRMTKSGRLLDISLTISPIKDSEGNVIGVSKIARDVSNQKIGEKLISESERKFRILSESIPQFIWTCDPSGNFNYFNQTIIDYSGLSYHEVKSEGWLKIVHPDEREDNLNRWHESIENGKEFKIEHRLRNRDGEYRWYLSRAIAQRDDNGMIIMWVGTSTDIHDQRKFTYELEKQVLQRTKELNEMNSDLMKSNNELAQFAYIASHDLQEPLRKIQTFATRIIQKEKENLTTSGIDYFDRIQNAANRMQVLIEDLLTYSRTNTAEKIFELTDLNLLLQEVKTEFDQQIHEKEATIISDILPVIKIIPFQFRQLFSNLLSNSLKFSKPDVPPVIEIKVGFMTGSEVPFKEVDPTKNYYILTFKDNGIGFEPQFKHKIFELFQRLHGKSEYSGTGIGLAICKKIVENHRGYIEADSSPGEGASFKIYLPVNN